MRLGCPGCGAQYEVEASSIPDDGREVQCSACGHTWFQYAPLTTAAFDAPAPLPVSVKVPARPPEDFRALLREEAAREATERRREGVGPIPAMAPPPVPAPAHRNSGFLTGFLLAAIPLAILAGVYAGAPRLEREVPALAEPLGHYVTWVDSLRSHLDEWLDRARSAG